MMWVLSMFVLLVVVLAADDGEDHDDHRVTTGHYARTFDLCPMARCHRLFRTMSEDLMRRMFMAAVLMGWALVVQRGHQELRALHRMLQVPGPIVDSCVRVFCKWFRSTTSIERIGIGEMEEEAAVREEERSVEATSTPKPLLVELGAQRSLLRLESRLSAVQL